MEDLKSNAEMAESVLQPHLVEQQHNTRRLAFVALRNARVMFVISLLIAGSAIYLVATNPHSADKTDFLLVGVAAMNLFVCSSRYRDAKQASGCVNRRAP